MCSNACDYCTVLLILFLVHPTLQFFPLNPFNLLNYAQTPPIQAQPITFKVPKKKLKELPFDPRYSNLPFNYASPGSIPQSSNVLLDPRYSNLPVNFASPGTIRQSSYGFPTVPTEDYGTNTQNLPDKIMLNGQTHHKTTRLELLFNKGVRGLLSAIPAETIQRIPKGFMSNYNEKEKTKKSKKEEKEEKEEEEDDDDSKYEYVYEDDDDDDDDNDSKYEYVYEDDDDDDDEDETENYNKDDRKNKKKNESSTKQGRKNRVSSAGDNRREKQPESNSRYEDSNGGNGLEENDSENYSYGED